MVAGVIDATLLLNSDQPLLQLIHMTFPLSLPVITPELLVSLSESLFHTLIDLCLVSLSADNHNVYLQNLFAFPGGGSAFVLLLLPLPMFFVPHLFCLVCALLAAVFFGSSTHRHISAADPARLGLGTDKDIIILCVWVIRFPFAVAHTRSRCSCGILIQVIRFSLSSHLPYLSYQHRSWGSNGTYSDGC
jgi:hypothetical protein